MSTNHCCDNRPLSYLRGAGDSRYGGLLRKWTVFIHRGVYDNRHDNSKGAPVFCHSERAKRPKNLGSPSLYFPGSPKSNTGPCSRRGIRALSCVYLDSSLAPSLRSRASAQSDTKRTGLRVTRKESSSISVIATKIDYFHTSWCRI